MKVYKNTLQNTRTGKRNIVTIKGMEQGEVIAANKETNQANGWLVVLSCYEVNGATDWLIGEKVGNDFLTREEIIQQTRR